MAGLPDLDTPAAAYPPHDLSGATLSRLNSIDRNIAELLATAKSTHALTRETNELTKSGNQSLRDIDASLDLVVGLLEQIKNRLPPPSK